MPRVYPAILHGEVAQTRQGRAELTEVAAGKIVPSHGIAEQGIARQQSVSRQKAHRPGRVSRRVDHTDRFPAQRHGVAVVQKALGGSKGFPAVRKAVKQAQRGVGQSG